MLRVGLPALRFLSGPKSTVAKAAKQSVKLWDIHRLNAARRQPRRGFATEASENTNSSKKMKWFKGLFGKGDAAPKREGPVAKKQRTTMTVHGVQIEDDYAWMQDLESNNTAAYILDETRHTSKQVSNLRSMMDIFQSELEQRMKGSDESVPEAIGDYYYYTKEVEKSEFQVYCRRKIHPPGSPEEIMLDANLISLNYDYLFISTIKLTKDQSKIVYVMDTTGTETFDAMIKDLATGDEFPKELLKGVVNVEWLPDGKSLLYSVTDDKKRPYRIYRHFVGTDPSDDVLIYEEKDDKFFLDIVRSKDWRYLTINSNSKLAGEILLVDTEDPNLSVRKIISRDVATAEYYMDHVRGKFYIVTNAGGVPNYQMFRVDVAKFHDRSAWELFVPAREHVVIEDVDVFNSHVVLYEKHSGIAKIRIINVITDQSHYVDLPHPLGHITPGTNLDFNRHVLRFSWSSPLHPSRVYDYNMNSTELLKLKQSTVPGAFPWNPEHFLCEIVQVDNNGVKVPMTLIRHRALQQTGENPVLMTGYGAYGTMHEAIFRLEHLSLLQRGWIIAVAHVRGGGDLGKYWYAEGKQLKKKNSFDDFVRCAEWLIENKWSNSEMMTAKAASAGGLLLAVIANTHPKLFKAMILKVPFVDVLTSMLDRSLPLTVHEFDEWGDPNESKEVFDYILSYDPYRNIKRQEYPHMSLTASTIDVRVPGWQPLKYVAKLREYKTDQNSLFIRIDTDVGHFGDGGRKAVARTFATEFAFLYNSLGYRPKTLMLSTNS